MKNSKYKALIVDDEVHCCNTLNRLIKQHCPQIEIIGSANSVDQAKPRFVEGAIDLIFLDVEMPEKNGFELLNQGNYQNIQTIFTTAHEKYALPALRNGALDLLLKPVAADDLVNAVDKLGQNRNVTPKKINGKIALPTLKGISFCFPHEIIRFEADGAYTRVIRLEDSIMVSRNIGYLEKIMDSNLFFRVHRSHLVNLSHIRQYIRGKGGEIVMSDESYIEVSRTKREDLLLAICY